MPQIKGARLAVRPAGGDRVEGVLLGIDRRERRSADGVVVQTFVSLLGDEGGVRQFDLPELGWAGDPRRRPSPRPRLLPAHAAVGQEEGRAHLHVLRSAAKARGAVRLSYTLEAPVWKATYRILLGEEDKAPLIQGWAVVDNTQDEDWEGVELSLVAGLPVSFVHDLYTPRYIRRPVVAVAETTGVLPPEVEGGMMLEALDADRDVSFDSMRAVPMAAAGASLARGRSESAKRSRR